MSENKEHNLNCHIVTPPTAIRALVNKPHNQYGDGVDARADDYSPDGANPDGEVVNGGASGTHFSVGRKYI